MSSLPETLDNMFRHIFVRCMQLPTDPKLKTMNGLETQSTARRGCHLDIQYYLPLILRMHQPMPKSMGRRSPNPPTLHMDRCSDWQKRPASEFFNIFLYLYLLALGDCVTFNKGGYGHWGLLIGVDQQTTATGAIKNTCERTNGSARNQSAARHSNKPLFLDAMD
jgi:hypothetical protein